MSEFLMIVPEGWSELPDGQAFVDRHNESDLLGFINRDELTSIEALLQDEGYIAPDGTISDCRMFRDGDTYRVWYVLG